MSIANGPLFFTGPNSAENRKLQRDAASGLLTRVAEGIYADTKGRPLEEVVCGAWAPLLARFVPGAILSGRSAMRKTAFRERGPDGRQHYPGWIFATDPNGSGRKRFSMTGLEIRTIPGPGPMEGDLPFLGVFLPSEARSLLENLAPSRSRAGPSRTAGREAVEHEVEQLLKTMHEDGLVAIRSRAIQIAPKLNAEAELPILLDIIGTILGTREAKLVSKSVTARRRVVDPYDPECMDRMKVVATTLARLPPIDRPDPHHGTDERSCASFIEAYFTNYIEGTRFLVDKARRIIFQNEEADGRPQDGRDITQTFAQVASLGQGASMASTAGEFMDEIRERNRQLLDARPDMKPGQFKDEPNRAGNTVFVMPDLVEGTLREGFAMLKGIESPIARALFTHALLVFVHPFNDGNGRTSRIMMTKELVAASQSRIVVPTIYRSDYIGGLRALGQQAPRATPYITSMLRCQSVTSKINPPDLDQAIALWASTHAFLENERDAKFTDPNESISIEWRKGVPAPASYWAELDLEAELAGDDEDAASVFKAR